MLRGVNKQIIEINSTENDFFEKAILYVRPEKADTDGEELHKKAVKFLCGFNSSGNIATPENKRRGIKFTHKKAIAAIAAALFSVAATIILLQIL